MVFIYFTVVQVFPNTLLHSAPTTRIKFFFLFFYFCYCCCVFSFVAAAIAAELTFIIIMIIIIIMMLWDGYYIPPSKKFIDTCTYVHKYIRTNINILVVVVVICHVYTKMKQISFAFVLLLFLLLFHLFMKYINFIISFLIHYYFFCFCVYNFVRTEIVFGKYVCIFVLSL